MQIIAAPLADYVLPITITVLGGLFILQAKGTGTVDKIFSPVMCFWFGLLAALGVINSIHEPVVLMAINPYYAVHLLIELGWHGFLIMGAIVLAITGAEALYADMGHFGLKPIRYAWFSLVFPALLLNYFGQGALLIGHPNAIQNPFYLLAPKWALYPLLILSTLATIIASFAGVRMPGVGLRARHAASPIRLIPRTSFCCAGSSREGHASCIRSQRGGSVESLMPRAAPRALAALWPPPRASAPPQSSTLVACRKRPQLP